MKTQRTIAAMRQLMTILAVVGLVLAAGGQARGEAWPNAGNNLNSN